MSRVTAVLVRAPGLPEGDTRTGVELTVCLDQRGQIQASCPGDAPWPVRRFWEGRQDWHGALVPVASGWAVCGANEDAPLWELQARVLRPGEYLTLLSPDQGETQFRIVNVETL
ncbi:MAG: hypothetical protein M3Y41_03290 [Pseudomonadota bacterium]|nr:hypothetical protein [Pseudomonadota bacterium]